jgi:hypothetical protein
MSLTSILGPRFWGTLRSGAAPVRRRAARPQLETLEDRTVLSTLTVMNINDRGPGSLRQAILDANSNDTINFAPALAGKTITLTTGELDITKSVNIMGPGASNLSISGNNTSRVFDVTSGTVTIAGLTITAGRSDKNAVVLPSVGGGILNQGTLTLTSDVVSFNQAIGDPNKGPLFNIAGASWGGGAANLGTLTVTGSTFIANLAQGGNNSTGSLSGLGTGGGIFNGGTLNVAGSTFAANAALGGNNNVGPIHTGHGVGGGISSGGSQVTVTGSTFTANLAQGGNNNQVKPPVSTADGPDDGFGGGLAVFLGTASVDHTAFSYNVTRGGENGSTSLGSLGVGGGLFVLNYTGVLAPPTGTVSATVSNSTFTGNAAIGGAGENGIPSGNGEGGGLANVSNTINSTILGATTTVSNSTFSKNLALGGPGGDDCASQGAGSGGGLFNDSGSTLTLTGSQVKENSAIGNPGIGGGVYTLGKFVNNGTNDISNNHASTSNDNIGP